MNEWKEGMNKLKPFLKLSRIRDKRRKWEQYDLPSILPAM
jgi:hypothetical protein